MDAPTERLRICWEGPQQSFHSMAIVNRAIEKELLLYPSLDLTIFPRESPFPIDTNIDVSALSSRYISAPPKNIQIHIRHAWPPNLSMPYMGHVVLIQPWEYGYLPKAFVAAVNRKVDEVWVPSTYVRDVYLASSIDPERVYVIPNGVDSSVFAPRRNYCGGSRDGTYIFLFVGGLLYRKGIDCLLQAYTHTFRRSDNVLLLIKDIAQYERNRYKDMINTFQSNPDSPQITVISDNLPETRMAELYNSCDCLLHPYRGEGFALPVLEAMSCGLPVIVTSGGATDDFVDETCGFLIPAVKTRFGSREIMGLSCTGDPWLMEPNTTELGKIMLDVCRNKAKARERGAVARLKVEKTWTWKAAADRIITRMHALVRRDVRRFSSQPK
jgi:glycosyltransferase involved in cell wall biosynthesis